jgi:hypothetical protein
VSRLIDIQPSHQDLPAELVVEVGDVLRFSATGGHIKTGTSVELIGILNDSVLGTNGRVLSPMGAPGTVLFLASSPGRAVIDIVTGNPWESSTARSLNILVE